MQAGAEEQGWGGGQTAGGRQSLCGADQAAGGMARTLGQCWPLVLDGVLGE